MEEKTKTESHDLKALGIIFNEEKLTCSLKNFKIPNSEFKEDLYPLLSEPIKENKKGLTAKIKGIQKISTFFQLVNVISANVDEILNRLLARITLPPRHIIFQNIRRNNEALPGMDSADIRFTHDGKKYILLRRKNGYGNGRKITELDPAFSMCFYLFLQNQVCLDIAVYDSKGLRLGVATEEITNGTTFHVLSSADDLPALEEFDIKKWARFFFANLLFEDSDAHDGNVLVVPVGGVESYTENNQQEFKKIDHDRCFWSKTSKYAGYSPEKIVLSIDGVYLSPVKSFAKITAYDIEHLPFVEDTFLVDGLVKGRFARFFGKSYENYFKDIDKNPEFIVEKYKCCLISLLLPPETFFNIFTLNVVSKKSITEYGNHIINRIIQLKECLMAMPQFWHHVIDHPEWLPEIIGEFNLINKKFTNLIDVASIEKTYFSVFKEIAKKWQEHTVSQLRFPTKILPESPIIEARAAKIDEFYSRLYPQFDMGVENNSSLYSEFDIDHVVVPPNIYNQINTFIRIHENNLKLIKNILDLQEGVEKLRNYAEVKGLKNLYMKSNAIFNRIDNYLMMMKRDPAYYSRLEAHYTSFKRELFELLDEDTDPLAVSIDQNDYSLIKIKIDFGQLSLADIWQSDAMNSALQQGRVQIVKLFFELKKREVEQEAINPWDDFRGKIYHAVVDYYLQCFDSNKLLLSKKHNLSQRCKDIGQLFLILNKEHQDVAGLISEITDWANHLKCGLLLDLNNGWRLGRSELRDVIMRAIAVCSEKSDKEAKEVAHPSSNERPIAEKHSDKIVEFSNSTPLQIDTNIENNYPTYIGQIDESIQHDENDLNFINNILHTQEKVEGLKNYFAAEDRGNMREKSEELLERIDDYLVMMKRDPAYFNLLKKRDKQFQNMLFELLDEATEPLVVNIDRDDYSLIKMKIDLGRLSLADIWKTKAMDYALKIGRTHIVRLFFELDQKKRTQPTSDPLDALMSKISNAAVDYYLRCFEKGSNKTWFFKTHDLSRRCKDIRQLFVILEQKYEDINELRAKVIHWANKLKCGLMPDPENGWQLGRSELRDEVMKVVGVCDDAAAAEAAAMPSSSISQSV